MFTTCKTITLSICKKSIFKSGSILPYCYGQCPIRLCSDKTTTNSNEMTESTKDSNTNKLTRPGLDTKYTVFSDSDATVLLDVYEEKMQLEQNSLNISQELEDKYYGLNLERGVHGVYDIEDLIELLKREKSEDIFVAELPSEAKYVDYIVIVSGRSRRHMVALAEIIRKIFKEKRKPTDILPRVEGEGSNKWIALDLGNIALHIFSYDARKEYDLESLWSVGPEFDPLINKPDDSLITLLKKHEIPLHQISSKGELL